jgi:valyl-tRNA synthetase
MLANDQFVARARPDVVEGERSKLADLKASADKINERLDTQLVGVAT